MKKYLPFISPKSLTILTIVVSAVLLASCDKQGVLDNANLLTFASLTDTPITKTTIDNVWSGGEQVQVSIDNGTAISFIAAPSGTLTPLSPIHWQNSSQSISARAWYPASWTFPVDQSGGLQPADFIFATTVTGITALNYVDNPLVFRHRTAKVTVNLTEGTDISSVNGAAVSFFGYTSGNAETSDAGDGLITGLGDGWITPQSNSDTYTALLIPREMTGIPFVRITIGGIDYFYTPATGQAVLQQGMAYTYNITVHKTRLDVEVVDNMEWRDSDEYDVIPTN